MNAVSPTLPRATLDADGIAQLVRAFYGKARKDAELGPVFAAAVRDWEAHLAHIAHFWRVVMLHEGRFGGNPMGAHARHAIKPEMFDRWLALWGETAHEVFAPAIAEQFTDRAERIAQSLKLGLFFRPGA